MMLRCGNGEIFDRYDKAIEIYEDVAKQSLNNNLLKYSVKGYLLNAGLCQICAKDFVGINNALEKYQVCFY
jgi:alpha-soluble NSF attachment protein